MEFKEYSNLIDSLNKKKLLAKDEKEKLEIEREIEQIGEFANSKLTAWDRVCIARSKERPKAVDYIEKLFEGFIELHGDRNFRDDSAILGGLAFFHGIPVTVIAQNKGKTVGENIKSNFGMSHPEGYRKAIRLAKQAEKFKRPIITFVDTAGAYPGSGAEERGQAEAIARCLFEFSNLETVVICVVLSEGGSGGALALSVGDCIIMLENAVYSILSPEGFSSILWKDASRFKEASDIMELTSYDLLKKGIIDEIIKEPYGGAQYDFNALVESLDMSIYNRLKKLVKVNIKQLLRNRYEKYRKVGDCSWEYWDMVNIFQRI